MCRTGATWLSWERTRASSSCWTRARAGDDLVGQAQHRGETRDRVVAHMADAERLVLQVAVAVADLVALRLQARDQCGNVEVAFLDASDRRRAQRRSRQIFDAVPGGPALRGALHVRVLVEARLPGALPIRALLRRGKHDAGRYVLELLRQCVV